MSAKDYRAWFATLPAEFADAVQKHWARRRELFVDRSRDPDGEIVIAAMQAATWCS
ncbi:cobaltochelatase, CobN subunit domain protein [Mycobacterium xenopi 4042]|uniref:Cobaltochelatase, CobN subunit domain protein n=1 Tax=Mycobacterium xenopi 4042 TaxID=1299334 RepID=X8BED4_MYCXE|nr:cobaltochelatase, CobN subunit domain protein [Mycobacterium xenopi 4042]